MFPEVSCTIVGLSNVAVALVPNLSELTFAVRFVLIPKSEPRFNVAQQVVDDRVSLSTIYPFDGKS